MQQQRWTGRWESAQYPRTGSAFAPGENANRAEVASTLYALLAEKTETADSAVNGSKVLTVYFSRTNHTKGVAEKVQTAVNSDTFEIVPKVSDTDADINYNDSTCRANREQSDPSARPAINGTLPDISDYSVIFLGYSIWYGQAPKAVYQRNFWRLLYSAQQLDSILIKKGGSVHGPTDSAD